MGKGVIGDTAGPMLGRLILSQLQAAAFKREKDGLTEDKVPTKNYVFIDEFQNFVSPTTGTIVAEARKYGISLILIQQYVGQGIDPGLMQNILTNTPLKITGVGTLSSYEKVMASQQVEREGFEGLRPRRFHVSRRGGRPFVTVAHGFLAGSKERMTTAEQAAFAELQLNTYYRSPHPGAQEGREDGEGVTAAQKASRRRISRPHEPLRGFLAYPGRVPHYAPQGGASRGRFPSAPTRRRRRPCGRRSDPDQSTRICRSITPGKNATGLERRRRPRSSLLPIRRRFRHCPPLPMDSVPS